MPYGMGHQKCHWRPAGEPRWAQCWHSPLGVGGGGVDGHPLPLACVPLDYAPHPPELDASPDKVVSKGLPSLLQRCMLSVGQLGIPGRSHVAACVR